MNLRVDEAVLDVVRSLPPVLREIERRDVDLGRQLRRAATSVVLNISEGDGSMGGTRMQRFQTALGSARESKSCLDVAAALGYCQVPTDLITRMDRVVGMLVRLIYR